jgi:uncharacterized protein YbjT (DUF2867 family)
MTFARRLWVNGGKKYGIWIALGWINLYTEIRLQENQEYDKESRIMSRQILILGATGMLGQPVTRCLVESGHRVRILARNLEKVRRLFGNTVEIVEGSALSKEKVRHAMAGCDAVHVNLPQASEFAAMQHVTDLGRANGLERITYVSATTACQENRWFEMVDVKIRTEDILQVSGIANTVFCPTWAMETLQNFIRGDRAVMILSKNPPPLHFIAGADFGRMVGASYEDDRALCKRLFVHGPEAVTLPDALERYFDACHPEKRIMRMKLWQARLIAKLTRREELADATQLIAYFDIVGELGDPVEANALFRAPSITLDAWFKLLKVPVGSAALSAA